MNEKKSIRCLNTFEINLKCLILKGNFCFVFKGLQPNSLNTKRKMLLSRKFELSLYPLERRRVCVRNSEVAEK